MSSFVPSVLCLIDQRNRLHIFRKPTHIVKDKMCNANKPSFGVAIVYVKKLCKEFLSFFLGISEETIPICHLMLETTAERIANLTQIRNL